VATWLGLDLGGTNARAAVVEDGGRMLASARQPVRDRAPEAVAEVLAEAAHEALAHAGHPAVQGCGAAVAGQLAGDRGVVVVGPNLGWRDVPLAALLEARLQLPIRLVNDLRAAAWGELHGGAGRGAQDILVVFVGSGVGSCAISGGRIITGASNVAGEFGHIKVAGPEGRPCGCGERGCLEAYVGGHNLAAQLREAVQAGPTALAALCAGELDSLHPGHLEQALGLKDPVAAALFERAAQMLSLAVANYVTVMNPARLILGGGVLSNVPSLRAAVVDGVQRFTNANARKGVQVVDAALGDDAGLVGAALLGASR
jgi:glucokinase